MFLQQFEAVNPELNFKSLYKQSLKVIVRTSNNAITHSLKTDLCDLKTNGRQLSSDDVYGLILVSI